MSRINNKDKYSIDTTVTLNDFLIGSDGDALGNIGATKNYPIKSIVRLISEVSGVTLNLFEIVSDPTNSATPEQGEIFTNDDVTEFTDIETIKISKFNSSGVDLTVYLSFIFENKDSFSLQFSKDGNYNVGAYADVSSFVDEGSYYTVNLNIPEENSYGSFSEGDFFSMDISTKITLKSTELSFLAFSVPSRGILGLTATLINLQRPLAPIEKGVIPFINVLVTGEQKIYILAFKDREFNGAYGPNGDITVTESDLQVIGERKLSLDNITDPSTDRIELGDIGNTPVWTFVGALDPSIQVQSETEGYTIFESVKQGVKKAWFYVGETGLVGLNDYQPIEDDFNEISTEPPIEIINIFPKKFFLPNSLIPSQTVEEAVVSSINTSSSPIRIKGDMLPLFTVLYGESKFVITFNKPVEGVYGAGFQSVSVSDIQIVSQFALNSFTVGDSSTDRIDLGEIGTSDLEDIVNALNPSIDVKPLAEGYTVFEALRNGISKEWLYLGKSGLIGLNDYRTVASDFKSLTIGSSATPNLQSVIDVDGANLEASFPNATIVDENGQFSLFNEDSSIDFVNDELIIKSPKLRILESTSADENKLLVPDENGYFKLIVSPYAAIDDAVVSTSNAWSSDKIVEELQSKLDLEDIYESSDFDIDFDAKTTDDLTEGSVNKYNKQSDFEEEDNTAPSYLKNKPVGQQFLIVDGSTIPPNKVQMDNQDINLYNWVAPTGVISFNLENLKPGGKTIIRVRNATAVASEILINGDGSASFIGSTDNWFTDEIMEISIFGLSTTTYEWWYNKKER